MGNRGCKDCKILEADAIMDINGNIVACRDIEEGETIVVVRRWGNTQFKI